MHWLILFEIENPNVHVICGHTTDSQYVAYYFLVTVTLFFSINFKEKIVKNVLSSVVKTFSTNVSNSRPITLQGHLSRN